MKFFVKKEKKAKYPLLQAYFVSLLSLVLCASMFLGTSFAWFSSDVTSDGNQIYVGTLEVKLSQMMSDGTWTQIDQTQTLAEAQEDPNLILNPDIRWEPGYTFIKWLRLENSGDLSFCYQLKMGIDSESTTYADTRKALETVGDDFVIFVYTGTYAEYVKPGSFEQLQADTENWIYVGTLAQVMDGKPILSGEMEASATPEEFAFAIHMNEDAGEDTMGTKLEGITVKVEAWQAAAEQDSLGGGYDEVLDAAAVNTEGQEG